MNSAVNHCEKYETYANLFVKLTNGFVISLYENSKIKSGERARYIRTEKRETLFSKQPTNVGSTSFLAYFELDRGRENSKAFGCGKEIDQRFAYAIVDPMVYNNSYRNGPESGNNLGMKRVKPYYFEVFFLYYVYIG